ncbi:MAG: arylesterase [Pseudomonadota bacterium]
MDASRFSFLTYGVAARMGKIGAALVLLSTPLAAEEVTVLALGDSLTQGFGLPQEDGLVPQLQRWLDERGVDATLINAGVSGDTTAGGAARVGWSLTPEVDAMIVTLGGNDMLRGLDPAEARHNIETILQVAQTEDVDVLLVGMQAPGNYGPEYKEAFDSLYPDLAQAYGTLFFESFFSGLGSNDPAQLRPFFQADGIHPNATGVARIVDALGPAVLTLVQSSAAAD